jgi:hypothetical protein
MAGACGVSELGDDRTRRDIAAAVMGYYEGWFDGDATRMERALHPLLVKRTLVDGTVETDTASVMVEATAAGLGRRRDPGDRRISVRVDDVHGSIATATGTSAVYVDYLQLVKVDDGWRILNALWTHA